VQGFEYSNAGDNFSRPSGWRLFIKPPAGTRFQVLRAPSDQSGIQEVGKIG